MMAYIGWATPERGTAFFRLQVYERVVSSLGEVYKRVGEFCHLGHCIYSS